MPEVYVRDGENLESLIKRFNRKVMLDGVLLEARKKEFFISPSRKRHEDDSKRKFRNMLNRKKAERGGK